MLFETAAYQLYNLRERYNNGTPEEKRLIVSSIFPEKIVFDGTQHRTQRVNEAIKLIYQKTSMLEGHKKGTNLSFVDLSQEVNLLVQNSNHLLEDLRRLNQQKDSPSLQNDTDIKTLKKQPQRQKNIGRSKN